MNEDMASIIDQTPAYIETPSIFKIKLAEYKEHQNHAPSPGTTQDPLDPTSNKNITDSFSNLNLDRDLNNLISKKPKRIDRYGGEQDSFIMAPQKKKGVYKDAYKTKKTHQEAPGKPYSMKNNTPLIKKPLKISINHL